jgi:hypothetical protein
MPYDARNGREVGVVLMTVQVETRRLVAAADTLTVTGRAIIERAGGVDRSVPAVPDDRHGLLEGIIELDEARQSFDERLGRVFEQAGCRLANQVVDTAAKDSGAEFAHLPLAGRP